MGTRATKIEGISLGDDFDDVIVKVGTATRLCVWCGECAASKAPRGMDRAVPMLGRSSRASYSGASKTN